MVSESQETIHLKISQTDRRIDWHFGCCQKVNIFMVKTDMMRHFFNYVYPLHRTSRDQAVSSGEHKQFDNLGCILIKISLEINVLVACAVYLLRDLKFKLLTTWSESKVMRHLKIKMLTTVCILIQISRNISEPSCYTIV